MKKLLSILLVIVAVNTANAQVYSESFENGGNMATGWTQEQATGTTAIWYAGAGPFIGANPQHGSWYVGYWGSNGESTKLVSPAINLSTTSTDTLTFYYCLRAGATFNVLYKNSLNSSWTTLIANLSPSSSWAFMSIPLPNPSSTYYLAFEGTSIGSDDMCLDNINIVNNY